MLRFLFKILTIIEFLHWIPLDMKIIKSLIEIPLKILKISELFKNVFHLFANNWNNSKTFMENVKCNWIVPKNFDYNF